MIHDSKTMLLRDILCAYNFSWLGYLYQ